MTTRHDGGSLSGIALILQVLRWETRVASGSAEAKLR